MNKRALVIGFGNPLRSDDAAGWQVAQDLLASRRPDIEVIAVHQLAPELAANIADAGLVLFIDSTLGAHAGEVAVHALAPAVTMPPQTHTLTPSALLAYARQLFGAAPPALLITIAGQSFEHGEQLSEAVRSALPAVFTAIERALARPPQSGPGPRLRRPPLSSP